MKHLLNFKTLNTTFFKDNFRAKEFFNILEYSHGLLMATLSARTSIVSGNWLIN